MQMLQVIQSHKKTMITFHANDIKMYCSHRLQLEKPGSFWISVYFLSSIINNKKMLFDAVYVQQVCYLEYLRALFPNGVDLLLNLKSGVYNFITQLYCSFSFGFKHFILITFAIIFPFFGPKNVLKKNWYIRGLSSQIRIFISSML